MSERLRLFILAGEPSGDRIAADLVRRLKARVELAFSGVGGDELEAEGLRSFFPMSDLAVMGISDVIRRLPLLLWRVEQTARTIRVSNPDIAVLVDAQDFSKLVARRLKRMGFKGKLILYVAPTVWARAPKRAAKLAPLFDEVLSVLPFEPAVMERLGGPPTRYVGHPALAEQADELDDGERDSLILLPGSRAGELRRHLPLFRIVAERLIGSGKANRVVIPTLPSLEDHLRNIVADWQVPVEIVSDRARRPKLYARARLAVSVAGTATLELALARVPMVVSYVMDRHQARVFEKLGRPMVSLPNIVLSREAVPELIQADDEPARLVEAAERLAGDEAAQKDQKSAFAELASIMERGTPEFPREDPADRILAHWNTSAR